MREVGETERERERERQSKRDRLERVRHSDALRSSFNSIIVVANDYCCVVGFACSAWLPLPLLTFCLYLSGVQDWNIFCSPLLFSLLATCLLLYRDSSFLMNYTVGHRPFKVQRAVCQGGAFNRGS